MNPTRRLASSIAAAVVLAAAPGCSGSTRTTDDAALTDVERGRLYAEDPAYRRAALEASLEDPDNGYSRLRLERYREDVWGALPLWNPGARPVTDDDVGRLAPEGTLSSLDVDSVPWEETALVELGRRAFLEYPAQLEPFAHAALANDDAPSHYGLWRAEGRIGGLVWTELPNGPPDLAFTCSSCHGTIEGVALVPGKNDAALNVASLASDFRGAPSNLSWGPGRVDVTDDASDNPVEIPDLRPIRYQANLQRAATVKNDLVALAVRTETLLVTALGESARPPRKLAFSLALYLFRLEAPPIRKRDGAMQHAEVLFHERCASCHVPPSYSGPAVPLEIVGTDPSVGESTDRGTGRYRVPTLHGVGDRTPLLATGAVRDVRELLDPARTAAGHAYGQDMGADDREALARFLETL